MNPQEDFQIGLNRSQKFTLGIVLLILVDIIWVASSELTKVRNNCIGGYENYVLM